MPLNSLFPRGSVSEQSLTENLVMESIKMYGQEFYYIPRNTVALDEILGEAPLSKFEHAYQIEGYIDNVDNFGGNGAFMSKFGMYIEEQAQITIARSRWENLVARTSNRTQSNVNKENGEPINIENEFLIKLESFKVPSRPMEGDLLYFPLTKGLFEIKFVDHQNPFYQLGRLYVYKLKVELFQYSSERIETDLPEVNQIALDMTFDILDKDVDFAEPEKRDFFDNQKIRSEADDILNLDERNPFGD